MIEIHVTLSFSFSFNEKRCMVQQGRLMIVINEFRDDTQIYLSYKLQKALNTVFRVILSILLERDDS